MCEDHPILKQLVLYEGKILVERGEIFLTLLDSSGWSKSQIDVRRINRRNQTEVNNMYIWKRPRKMEKCVKMAETLILKYYL